MSASQRGKLLAIGVLNARRFLRDRTNLFFAFVFPLALVLVIGLQFGGDDEAELGIAGPEGSTARAVLEELQREHEVDIERFDSAADLQDRVEERTLDGGVVFPDDLDAALAAGRPVEVAFLAANTAGAQQLSSALDAALATVVAVPTAERAAVARGADPDDAAAAAQRLAPQAQRISVRTVTAGDRLFPEGTAGVDVAAPSQLVLFTFLTSLAGSYALIQTRQLGLSRRMLATPTPARTVIGGEALGRWLIAVMQAVYILLTTWVLFGIDWGDPIGAIVVIAALAAVAAGAAMVFGTVFSNPDQASGVGVVVSLCLGALGGAMLPIELFGDTLATVAKATPHYWAIDAFAELVRHDGSVADVVPQVAVLLATAVVLLLVASWRMRVAITAAGSSTL